jgi:hypothetical protein
VADAAEGHQMQDEVGPGQQAGAMGALAGQDQATLPGATARDPLHQDGQQGDEGDLEGAASAAAARSAIHTLEDIQSALNPGFYPVVDTDASTEHMHSLGRRGSMPFK